jgi:hypothetical protein
MIERKSKAGRGSTPTQIRLEKASREMVKAARDLTERKGRIDGQLLDLRVSQAHSPVRKLTKK